MVAVVFQNANSLFDIQSTRHAKKVFCVIANILISANTFTYPFNQEATEFEGNESFAYP
jgi:hypothetical protein